MLLGQRLAVVESSGEYRAAAGVFGDSLDHRACGILDQLFGPQLAVADTDLPAEFRNIGVDDFVAEACRGGGLVLKATEQVARVAQSAECEQIRGELIVRLPQGIPALGGREAGTLPVQATQMEGMLPGCIVVGHIDGGMGRLRVRVAL